MAISFSSCEHAQEEEEDYIDMEVSSSTTFLCYTISSSPQQREFEFHKSLGLVERERSTSPADELFYEGNLLPLHLPPRLQMVQKLLDHKQQNSNPSTDNSARTELTSKESYSTPNTITCSTPLGSCSVSPSQSCRVSGELNRVEFFSGFLGEQPKKSWSKKFKLIGQSSLGLKLKASRAYLKSLFSKSRCSHETSAEAARNVDEFTVSKAKESLNRYMKVTRKNPFGQIPKERLGMAGKEKFMDEGCGAAADGHRRSFSGVIRRHSAIKSSPSSSSFSINPDGFFELPFLKRSSSASSEIESSIQGAIAHCKQSHQPSSSRKTLNEVGFCSFATSRIAVCENQESPGHCRG